MRVTVTKHFTFKKKALIFNTFNLLQLFWLLWLCGQQPKSVTLGVKSAMEAAVMRRVSVLEEESISHFAFYITRHWASAPSSSPLESLMQGISRITNLTERTLLWLPQECFGPSCIWPYCLPTEAQIPHSSFRQHTVSPSVFLVQTHACTSRVDVLRGR